MRRNRNRTAAITTAPTANTANAMPTADPVLSPEAGVPECSVVDWVNGAAVVVNVEVDAAVLVEPHCGFGRLNWGAPRPPNEVHGEPLFPLSSKPQIKEDTAEAKGGNDLVMGKPSGKTVVVRTVVRVVSASSTGISAGY